MTPRFFAFGCSFTAYAWPSWADLVGTHFPEEYYNYGRSGAGNSYIFNRFIQAHQVHKFTKDDLVIVQWSTITREDRYLKGSWVTKGSVQNFYTDEFIRKYFDETGYLIRDIALFAAVNTILDQIGCEYYFTSLESFNTNENIKEVYSDVLSIMKPSYFDILGRGYNPRTVGVDNVVIDDYHPIPGEHLHYINKVIPQWAPADVTLADRLDKLTANGWVNHNKCWDFYDWPIDRGFENIEKDL